MRLAPSSEFQVKQFTGSLVLAAFALAMLAGVAIAQTTISTGSIQGTITDSSGAVLGGARVTITNKSTGQVITTTSSSSGLYTSGSLTPGEYVVRTDAKGFKS